MENLKWHTVCLLLYLAIFFNIERLGILGKGEIHLNAFIYLIGIFIVLFVVVVPRSNKLSCAGPLLICMTIYVAANLLVPDSRILLSEFRSFIYITETVLLVSLVFLACKFSNALEEFTQGMEDILLSNVRSHVKSFEDAQEDILAEFNRSRRYNHPLKIIIVDSNNDSYEGAKSRIVEDMQKSFSDQYLRNKLGSVLSVLIRRSDLIFEQEDKKRFVLVCPEMTESRFVYLANRIKNVVTEQLNLTVTYGVSSFPEESVTFDELMTKAESQLSSDITYSEDIKN